MRVRGEFLSSLTGLWTARLVDPPMNRWAIIGCPCRDKQELTAEADAVCLSILLRVVTGRPWPVGFGAESQEEGPFSEKKATDNSHCP